MTGRPKRRYGDVLYERAEPWAHAAKVLLQMVVGLVTIGALGWQIAGQLDWVNDPFFVTWQPLRIVAAGLEFAAGIELAYLLFTDGPDEAIQPLILGLAAATLLAVSSGISAEKISPMAIIAVPVLVSTIALLLWVQRTFFPGSAPTVQHEPDRTSGPAIPVAAKPVKPPEQSGPPRSAKRTAKPGAEHGTLRGE